MQSRTPSAALQTNPIEKTTLAPSSRSKPRRSSQKLLELNHVPLTCDRPRSQYQESRSGDRMPYPHRLATSVQRRCPLAFASSVLLHNVADSLKPPQRGELLVVKRSFDLRNPEVDSAPDSC